MITEKATELVKAGYLTFTMIKPNAVKNGHTESILRMIKAGGFDIVAIRELTLSRELAYAFYAEHEGMPYYEPLVDYMTSGRVVAALLRKENAVADYRKLIGTTDPATAAEGTIRRIYGTTTRYNAVHGSDSDVKAIREAAIFFEADTITD
jgi:nucleoside-diphosphate kinase